MGIRAVAPAALAALIGLAALTGCGGSTKTTTTVVTAVGQSGSATSVAQTSAVDAVATVERTPITKASLEHWMSVTAALNHSKVHSKAARAALKKQVLSFLITSQWVLGEAAHLGIGVSEAEVRRRLRQITAKQFPKASQLKRYLASIGETEADLLMRVKVELLESKIAQHVTAGKTASTEPHLLLSEFQKSFEARWRARTSCRPGYVIGRLQEYKGAPHTAGHEQLLLVVHVLPLFFFSFARAIDQRQFQRERRAALDPRGDAISSPAFERNGAIPAQYTCDGANISPAAAVATSTRPHQGARPVRHRRQLRRVDKAGSAGCGAASNRASPGSPPAQLPSGAVVGLNELRQGHLRRHLPAKGAEAPPRSNSCCGR